MSNNITANVLHLCPVGQFETQNHQLKNKVTMEHENLNNQETAPLSKGAVGGSLLMRSLSLLEEMIDNHNADAVQMSEQHYKEVKQLIKDIRKSNRL